MSQLSPDDPGYEALQQRIFDTYRTTPEGRKRLLDSLAVPLKHGTLPTSNLDLAKKILDMAEGDGHDVQGLRHLLEQKCKEMLLAIWKKGTLSIDDVLACFAIDPGATLGVSSVTLSHQTACEMFGEVRVKELTQEKRDREDAEFHKACDEAARDPEWVNTMVALEDELGPIVPGGAQGGVRKKS